MSLTNRSDSSQASELTLGALRKLTAKQALALPAGANLDAYLHLQLSPTVGATGAIPPYSRSLDAAFLLVEELAVLGWALHLSRNLAATAGERFCVDFVSTDWFTDEFAFDVFSDCPCLAICRAAIHALSVREVPSDRFSDCDKVRWTADRGECGRVFTIDSPQFELLGELSFLITCRSLSVIVPTAELRLLRKAGAV